MVVALFTFMNAWNEYLQPLIYINQETLYWCGQVSLPLSDVGEYAGDAAYCDRIFLYAADVC